jgi:sugar phosphate isomerase/epimerase
MKLAFSTLSCPQWSLAQIIDAARANSITGVDFRGLGDEIDITKLPQFTFELDATLESFRARGLEMPCFNTSVTLISPGPERWQMMLEECQRYAQLASRSGTLYLRIFGGGLPKGMAPEEARQMARRHLRQLVRICQGHQTQPLLETHDEWSTSDRVLELLEGFDPSEVAVLWDVEHPWSHGEPPHRTADQLKEYIRHIHIKDSEQAQAQREPRLLGEGDLPLAECATALRGIGYDQWICLESEKRWHREAPEPEISLPQFVGYMHRHWTAL